MSIVFSVAIAVIAAMVCAGLIFFIRPWLQRYALARPNARSSHKIPTPQGGGIAVIASTLAVSAAVLLTLPVGGAGLTPTILFAATILIAGAGATDDIRPIGVVPRLLLQALAV